MRICRRQHPEEPAPLATAQFTGHGDTAQDIEDDVERQARAFFQEGSDITFRPGWRAIPAGRNRGHFATITVDKLS